MSKKNFDFTDLTLFESLENMAASNKDKREKTIADITEKISSTEKEIEALTNKISDIETTALGNSIEDLTELYSLLEEKKRSVSVSKHVRSLYLRDKTSFALDEKFCLDKLLEAKELRILAANEWYNEVASNLLNLIELSKKFNNFMNVSQGAIHRFILDVARGYADNELDFRECIASYDVKYWLDFTIIFFRDMEENARREGFKLNIPSNLDLKTEYEEYFHGIFTE